MGNLKYYLCKSLNNWEFALITDQPINEKHYNSIIETSRKECEKKAKETALISNHDGITRKYIYNPARQEFDCTYSSAGTNMGGNDWGFVR